MLARAAPHSTEIGPYTLLRPIRRGGQGTVYAAHDRRLNRRVALKLIAIARDKELRERVVTEARSLARLNHRSIVQIFDIVETRSHIALVMEYVPGTDLHSLNEQTTLGLPAVLQLAMDLCAALAAAHQAGIVHRDLKPGNVLLDPAGRIKLTDFGIALALVSRHDREETLAGLVPGTYFAMSPEHAAGLEPDQRSDIFALGLIIYRCLAGCHPFAEAANELAFVQQLIHAPHRPLLECREDVPVKLSRLLDTMLCKDPRQRPGSVVQVRQSLLSILRSMPVTLGQGLAAAVAQHGREEDKTLGAIALPADIARNARSRLLPAGEWGAWGLTMRGVGRRSVLTVAGLAVAIVAVYGGVRAWKTQTLPVAVLPPVVLGHTATASLPRAEDLASMVAEALAQMPNVLASAEQVADRVHTRVRCNPYLCELQLMREGSTGGAEYMTLLPDAPPSVWRAQVGSALQRLFP